MELPSNSQTTRVTKVTETTEEPGTTVETEVTEEKTQVRIEKSTLGSRFKGFFASGAESFTEHLIKEVLIPGLQEVVIKSTHKALDGIAQAVEQVITGNTDGVTTPYRSTSRRGPIPYNRMSGPSRNNSTIRSSRSDYRPRSSRRSDRVHDVVLDSRDDAMELINHLDDLIDRYGHCTVGDLYDYLGNDDVQSVDHEWGWTNLKHLVPSRIGNTESFKLRFPHPRSIIDGR